MAARLWIREPSGGLREVELDDELLAGEGVVIGREAAADIVLDDEAVSRFHARITGVDEGWKIADLGSSNKTFVNGDPVRDAALQPGDQIGIGDTELQLLAAVSPSTEEASQTQVLARVGSSPAGDDDGQRAAAVLAGLYELSRELLGVRDDQLLLERGVRILVESFGADRGAALSAADGDALLCRAAHSRAGQAMRGFILSQSIYREVMQSREAILSRDTSVDQRFAERASIVGEEIRSVIAAPIRSGERIHGILYLDRLEEGSEPFSREDLYAAAVAAEFLGAALRALDTVETLTEERDNLVKTIIDTHPIIGTSAAIARVREFIRRAAPTDSTVLIQGETGTGKELVAHAIHYQSHRSGQPFIAINCAAIPESLVESELFGHERGAFTGAVERKVGKFEAADKGTVFLDEIGELPLGCQSKLLRLLEERCFERVGGTRSVSTDVRIVAATNRDLAQEVGSASFREDLFYRLNVLQVNVPPLRERPEDLALLVDHFLDLFARRAGASKELSTAARERLLTLPWPGNVRQLRNAIESAMVLSQGAAIEVDDLPLASGPPVATSASTGDGATEWQPRSIQAVEREHIERVLDAVQWNKSKAAELLGIERSTLYARIRSYQLKPPAER